MKPAVIIIDMLNDTYEQEKVPAPDFRHSAVRPGLPQTLQGLLDPRDFCLRQLP